MALVTVQRSPSPSDTSERSQSDDDEGLTPTSQRRRSSTLNQFRKLLNSVRFLTKLRRRRESFFAVKGTALVLAPTECPRRITTSFTESDGISSHLQSMFYLLRPQDTIKVAVKLEAMVSIRHRYMVVVSCVVNQVSEEYFSLDILYFLAVKLEAMVSIRHRYMVVVSCVVNQVSEECVILGIDCNDRVTIGLVLPVYSDTRIELNGDGGFHIMSHGHKHLFKPISVQAMWSVLQSLYKVANHAARNKYHPNSGSHTWLSFYQSRIKSDHQCILEWFSSGDTGSVVTDSRVTSPDDPGEDLQKVINNKLREIMFTVDLEEVTGKFLRASLEASLGRDLSEYKNYIDRQTMFIYGQMDAASCILPNLYLGSEWNASNLEELKTNDVRHILNISREIDNFFPGMFKYMNVREFDVEETDLLKYWDKTSTFIQKGRQNGHSVLVHCKMGVSRSAATVIAFVMKEKGWNLEETIKYVRSKRSIIKPLPAFIKQLEIYQGILNASRQRYNSLFKSKSVSNLQQESEDVVLRKEERRIATPTVPRRKSWASQDLALDCDDDSSDADSESSLPIFNLHSTEDDFEDYTQGGDIVFLSPEIGPSQQPSFITLEVPGESSDFTSNASPVDDANANSDVQLRNPDETIDSNRVFLPVDRSSVSSLAHIRPDDSWIQPAVDGKTDDKTDDKIDVIKDEIRRSLSSDCFSKNCDTDRDTSEFTHGCLSQNNEENSELVQNVNNSKSATVNNVNTVDQSCTNSAITDCTTMDVSDATSLNLQTDNLQNNLQDSLDIPCYTSSYTFSTHADNKYAISDGLSSSSNKLPCDVVPYAGQGDGVCPSPVQTITKIYTTSEETGPMIQPVSITSSVSLDKNTTKITESVEGSKSESAFYTPVKLERKSRDSSKLCEVPFDRLLNDKYSTENDALPTDTEEMLTEPELGATTIESSENASDDLTNKENADTLNKRDSIGASRLRPDNSWIIDDEKDTKKPEAGTENLAIVKSTDVTNKDIYLNDYDIEPCDAIEPETYKSTTNINLPTAIEPSMELNTENMEINETLKSVETNAMEVDKTVKADKSNVIENVQFYQILTEKSQAEMMNSSSILDKTIPNPQVDQNCKNSPLLAENSTTADENLKADDICVADEIRSADDAPIATDNQINAADDTISAANDAPLADDVPAAADAISADDSVADDTVADDGVATDDPDFESKFRNNKLELGVLVHYVKEDIPWHPGTVKKHKEEMEQTIQRRSLDIADMTPIDPLPDTKPIQRSASLKTTRASRLKSAERRKTCTPILSPEIEAMNKKLPVAVYNIGNEEVPLKVGLVRKHTQEFENLNDGTEALDVASDSQTTEDSMDISADVASSATENDFIDTLVDDDAVKIDVSPKSLEATELVAKETEQKQEASDELEVQQNADKQESDKADKTENKRVSTISEKDNSEGYIPENIVPYIVQSIEKRQSRSDIPTPVTPTLTYATAGFEIANDNFNSNNSTCLPSADIVTATESGGKVTELKVEICNISQETKDDSLPITDTSTESQTSLNKETLFLIREIGSALYEPTSKDETPLDGKTEKLSKVKTITRQIESRSLPRKTLLDRVDKDSPQKRLCQRPADYQTTTTVTTSTASSNSEAKPMDILPTNMIDEFRENICDNIPVPPDDDDVKMDITTDANLQPETTTKTDRSELNLDLESDSKLPKLSPHEESHVDGLEFIDDNLVQTLVGKFELGQFNLQHCEDIDSPLSSSFSLSYNDLSTVSELEEPFSDRETPLSREALNTVITKYGTPQHGIFYHFNRTVGHSQGRKIRRIHGKSHPLHKLWPHSTM